MDRAIITTKLIGEAEQLLNEGLGYAEVARRLRITVYLARLLSGERLRTFGNRRKDTSPHQMRPSWKYVDVATVRMVHRMLAVGILTYKEIAREAAVSHETVVRIASGKRLAISTNRPVLARGETFLREPIRCGECGNLISVRPCRLCRHEESVRMRREFQRLLA